MNLPPVLAALRKHKPSVVMVILQIAVTLAIVCNAVFIIGNQIRLVNRPTGLDEANLFVISQMYANAPHDNSPAAIQKLDAMELTDIATLRGLPDVQSVATINSAPLMNTGNQGDGVSLHPNQRNPTTDATVYYVGDQGLETLGLHLVAGRNFTPGEIEHMGITAIHQAPVLIVTRALADRLFPHGNALGKAIYLSNSTGKPSRIIGIVARLQAMNGTTGKAAWYSMLAPIRQDFYFTTYAVRAKPGREAAAIREARKALYAVDPMRIVNNSMHGAIGIRSYASIRALTYRNDRGMAIVMGVISLILLLITGAGMVGVTSFWVGQRTKQIGIRRALGATRANIMHYFQIENLIIAGGGVVLGAILAVGLNLWLMKQFSMDRMPVWYVLIGVVALLLLGQLAVLAPARRASRVPPVVATRSV